MKESKNIIILGTGGDALDILLLIEQINGAKTGKYKCIGFLDDEREKNTTFGGLQVLGSLKDAHTFSNCVFVNSIGSPRNFHLKEKIIKKTGLQSTAFETLIHPSIFVPNSATIGYGTVISPFVHISNNVHIGNHIKILSHCVFSHGDKIGDYSSIASSVSIAGEVTIGKSCYLGANSAIRDNVTIGDNVLIGMGSVVIKSIETGVVIVGNPGKVLRNIG